MACAGLVVGWWLCLVTVGLARGTSVFTEQPADVSVTEGGRAEFRCGLDAGLAGLQCGFFYWRRYEAASGQFRDVSKCLRSYEPRYSVRSDGDGVYTLAVDRVRLEESGSVYECWQYSQANGWLQSPNATLTVLTATTPPVQPMVPTGDSSQAGPVCSTSPPGPHGVGDAITLECAYHPATGEPPVAVSWSVGGRLGDHHSLQTRSGLGPAAGELHRVQMNLTEWDNFERFVCSVEPVSSSSSLSLSSSPARANCSLVPLAIPTVVSVTPARPPAVAPGGDVVFRCRAEAVPPATSYRWLVTKLGGAGVGNSTGDTLRLASVSAADDGAEVVCLAANELGLAGRSRPAVLRVAGPVPVESGTGKGRGQGTDGGEIAGWSHIALVVGIMLCVVVLFVAAGLGVLYAGWRKRMSDAARRASGSGSGGAWATDRRRPSRETPLPDHDSPTLRCFSDETTGGRNLYVENDYMEIFGSEPQSQHLPPAPAHERAVEKDHTYDRHF